MATGKYDTDTLVRMFRKAAVFRNEMREAGFTDNGGAIHSAERILNILGQRLNYPGLSHINNLRKHAGAEFSLDAFARHESGARVLIEHVSPLRHLTQQAIDKILNESEDAFLAFVKSHYRLVLLTPEEMAGLNRSNRSKIDPRRLEFAGIRTRRRDQA